MTTLYTINIIVASGTMAEQAKYERIAVGALPEAEARALFAQGNSGNLRWVENGRRMAYCLRPVR